MEPKVTIHKDYSVSLRLRKYSAGDNDPGMDDVVHALRQAECTMLQHCGHDETGKQLAARYRALADTVEAAMRGIRW